MNDDPTQDSGASLDANEQLLRFYESVVQQQARELGDLRRERAACLTTPSAMPGSDDPRYRALQSELAMVYASEAWRVGRRIVRVAQRLHVAEFRVFIVRLLRRA